MKRMNKLVLFAMLSATAGLAGLAPANAVTFDFQSPAGLLGTTQSYTSGGITINAAGFTSAAALAGAPNATLFGKTLGGDENGLGLSNDTTGDNEIQGTNIVRIQVPTGLTALSFTMGSVSPAGVELWSLWGNTSGTSFGGPALISNANDMSSHDLLALCPTCTFFFWQDTGGSGGAVSNVLIHNLTAVSAVPLPGALPLFATGLGLMGLLGLRKRRKAPAVTA